MAVDPLYRVATIATKSSTRINYIPYAILRNAQDLDPPFMVRIPKVLLELRG